MSSCLHARIGYYFEICVALECAELFNLVDSSLRLLNKREAYLNKKLIEECGEKAIFLAHQAEALSIKTAKEIYAQYRKYQIIEVRHTGTEDMLNSVSDVEFVTMDLITLPLSIKYYRGKSINVANSTYLSWLKDMFMPDEKLRDVKFINAFCERFEVPAEYKKSLMLSKASCLEWSKIKAASKQAGNKEYSKVAKNFMYSEGHYVRTTKLLSDIFNYLYPKHKAAVDKNSMLLMGLNYDTDIWITFYEPNDFENCRIESSALSYKFAYLLDMLRRGFNVFVEPIPNTISFRVTYSTEDEVLLVTNSGLKEAHGLTTNIESCRFI